MTNLTIVFSCKFLGGNNDNSRVPDSFDHWALVNNIKFYGGWVLAAALKIKRIFQNVVEMLILFELIALLLVINREKNKSLDHLLFQANELSSEAQRFKLYEKTL